MNSYQIGGSFSIPDELWARSEPLIPPPKPRKRPDRPGRPRQDNRQMLTAIFYLLRTGCQWHALPRHLGAPTTVHDRFQEWRAAGVFEALWRASVEQTQGLCLDKGYDYPEVREILEQWGYTAHIRTRGEEARDKACMPGYRARRWVVERTHAWMNRFRRLLIRWVKKVENYLGMLHFACAIICFRAAGIVGQTRCLCVSG